MRRAGLRADNHDIDYYLQGVYKSRFLPLPEGKNHGVVLPISSFPAPNALRALARGSASPPRRTNAQADVTGEEESFPKPKAHESGGRCAVEEEKSKADKC
jgi:hypothetical protein